MNDAAVSRNINMMNMMMWVREKITNTNDECCSIVVLTGIMVLLGPVIKILQPRPPQVLLQQQTTKPLLVVEYV